MAAIADRTNSKGAWLEILAMQCGYDMLDEALAARKITDAEYLLLTDRVSKNRRRLIAQLGQDEAQQYISKCRVISDPQDGVIGKIEPRQEGGFRASWFSKNAWGTAVLDSLAASEQKIRRETRGDAALTSD